MEDYLRWWPVLLVVLNVVMLWVSWSVRQAFTPRAEVHQEMNDLKGLLAKHHERISRLELQLEDLPKRVETLLEKVGGISTGQGVMGERLAGVKAAVERLDDQLQLILQCKLEERP